MAVLRKLRHTHADRHPLSRELLIGNTGPDTFGHFKRCITDLARDQDRELLSAVAGGAVFSPGRAPKDSGDLLQDLVSSRMAVGIVVFLEAIHVGHQNGEGMVVTMGSNELFR